MQLLYNRYSFTINAESLPPDFAFDPFLFLQDAHLKTQAEDELLIFQLLDQKTGKIVARLPFFIDQQGLAYSPGRAPFGSVQFKNRLQENVLGWFLENVKRYLLEEKKCRSIRIKSYPFAYATAESALLTDLLLKQGYAITCSEINHHITVNEKPVAERMYRKTRWSLTKSRKSGFVFREDSQAGVESAYTFIWQCLSEKGYVLSLPLATIEQLFQLFPATFRIFWVHKETEPAACCICVQINAEILYYFYVASKSGFNNYSPVVLLIDGLYQVCQQEGITLLDLGTSNLPSGPNFPLIAFKKHLGGEPSLKLTFEFKT